MLSADDGVHAVAYDAVMVTVSQSIALSVGVSGTNLKLSWTGAAASYVVQQMTPGSGWTNVLTTSVQNATVPMSSAQGLFRVVGQ
jgi:hypothetical protein